MKKEILEAVAKTIGNGYKCYVQVSTGKVFSVDEIDLETRQGSDYKEYVPLDGTVFFKMMEEFVASIEDFEHQSELMETLQFEQPFQNFKRKVYSIHLADDWIAFRTEKIVGMLSD